MIRRTPALKVTAKKVLTRTPDVGPRKYTPFPTRGTSNALLPVVAKKQEAAPLRCSKTFRVFKAAFALEVVIRGLARLEDPELLNRAASAARAVLGSSGFTFLPSADPNAPALAVGLELREHGPHPGSCCDA